MNARGSKSNLISELPMLNNGLTDEGVRDESTPCESLPMHRVSALLSGVARVVQDTSSSEDIRARTLQLICDLVGARAALWAWGKSGANVTAIQPLAVLTVGYNQQQKGMLAQFGLDPEMENTFRRPVAAMMTGRNQVSICRRQLFADEAWQVSRMYEHQRSFGFDSWLHAVRYESADTWSNVFMSRLQAEPEFDVSDASLLHVALESLPWMRPTIDPQLHGATVSPFLKLTDRQRTVVLLLLDGLSRKVIASQLKISEDTVGDHIKAIYRQFDVGSVGELVAKFLRSH